MGTKAITILMLMTFLISCKNQKFICREIKNNMIAPTVLYDVSFVFNRCRARCFDANKWETLPISSCPKLIPTDLKFLDIVEDHDELSKLQLKGSPQAVNLDLEDCEGVAGFKVNDMALEIRPKVKRLNDLKIDSCGE